MAKPEIIGSWRAYTRDEATMQIAADGTFHLHDRSTGATVSGSWKKTGLFTKALQFNGKPYRIRIHDDGNNNYVLDLRSGDGSTLDRRWYRKIKGDWMF